MRGSSGAAEPARVRTSPVSGAPERVVWRGRSYLVVEPPVPWVERLPWWEGAGPERTARRSRERRVWRARVREEGGAESPGLLLDLTVGESEERWSAGRVAS